MSTVQVVVPVNESDAVRQGWIENISQHIDAGNDVEFIDHAGEAASVSMISLNTAGSVCFWGTGMVMADAKAVALAETGWHVIPGIRGIRAAGTTTSIGIHVKV
jgi:hypothetical protein